jgi:exonuclease VII small subunit
METKVTIEGKPLSQKNFKKLEKAQKQVEEIDTDQEEKDMVQSFCFCFEGFC